MGEVLSCCKISSGFSIAAVCESVLTLSIVVKMCLNHKVLYLFCFLYIACGAVSNYLRCSSQPNEQDGRWTNKNPKQQFSFSLIAFILILGNMVFLKVRNKCAKSSFEGGMLKVSHIWIVFEFYCASKV